MRFAVMRRGPRHAEITASQLTAAGFGIDPFDSLADGIAALADNPYDLVLSDARLRDGDAIRWLRSRNDHGRPDGLFVVLFADREDERIAALDAGADDCLSPTVSERELVARIRALLRRPRERAAFAVTLGNLSLSTEERNVTVGGRDLSMQRREIDILEALLRRAGNVVVRAALEHDVYGLSSEATPNSLEVRISRLRRRLDEAGASPTIETVRGIGYRMVDAGRPGPAAAFTARRASPTPRSGPRYAARSR